MFRSTSFLDVRESIASRFKETTPPTWAEINKEKNRAGLNEGATGTVQL